MNLPPQGKQIIAFVGTFLSLGALPAFSASVIFTNDILGELVPCGCRSNPLGGVVREARYLNEVAKSPRLTLDAGDLLFPTGVVPDTLIEQSKLQASYVIEALNRMSYDAATPGEKDFALGLENFKTLTSQAKFVFLSTNLKDQDGDLILPPHKVFQLKESDGTEIEVAVFGLSGSKLEWGKELQTGDPIEAARAQVKKLKKDGRVLIALTHQCLAEDERLAREVPGIDFIVGAHTQSFLQSPRKVGESVIGQSSFRNQYLGRVPLKAKLDIAGYELVPLEEKYDDAQGTKPSPMAVLLAEFESKRNALNLKEPTKRGEATLYHTFPKCAECHTRQFDFWRKTPHIQALESLVRAKQHHNKECLQCHTVGFADPRGFSNVTTIALRKVETGAGESEEFIRSEELTEFLHFLKKAPSLVSKIPFSKRHPEKLVIAAQLNKLQRTWAPVQCENCHSPGGDHPFSGTYVGTVEQESCLQCHTPERAPAWYAKGKPDLAVIQKKLKQVSCPKGAS